MEPQTRAEDWHQSLAQNERLCKTIAEHFGWMYRVIPVEKQNLCIINPGRCWVSLQHISYGGVSGDVDINELLTINGLSGGRWQVRGPQPFSSYYRNDKVSSYLMLAPEVKRQMKILSSGVRRKIHKAQRSAIHVSRGGEELLENFYSVYTRNMHRLGAPALSKDFIRSILRNYHDGYEHTARLFVAWSDRKPIGAALLLGADRSYENLLFGSLRKYNRYYTTYLLHWEMIQYAIKQQGTVYSFGRSTKNSGVHRYKQQWGTKELPIFQSYSHPAKNSIKDLKFLASLWRLLPYPVAKAIGPWFAWRIY